MRHGKEKDDTEKCLIECNFSPPSLETRPLAQLFTNTARLFNHPYALPPYRPQFYWGK
jgi:hypothetical protein